MELLDCQGLQLAGLNRPGNVQLRKIYLNGCDSLSNQAACSLIEMCGVRLKRFIIIGKKWEVITSDRVQSADCSDHDVMLSQVLLA